MPQGVPASALPVTVQAPTPPVQVTVPTWQRLVGWQVPPGAHPRKSQVAETVPVEPQSVVYLPWMKLEPFTWVPLYWPVQRTKLIPSVSKVVGRSCVVTAPVLASVQVSVHSPLMPQRKPAPCISAMLRSRFLVWASGTQVLFP